MNDIRELRWAGPVTPLNYNSWVNVEAGTLIELWEKMRKDDGLN